MLRYFYIFHYKYRVQFDIIKFERIRFVFVIECAQLNLADLVEIYSDVRCSKRVPTRCHPAPPVKKQMAT